MKPTEMNICAVCQQKLEDALDMTEIPGTALEKTACAFCGAKTYGGRFVVRYRKNRKER